MILLTVEVLLPVLFVLALGYAAGFAKHFDTDQAAGIISVALDFALPASLFVGIVSIPRFALAADFPFVVSVILTVLVSAAIAFVIGLRMGFPIQAAALFMFAAAAPATVFFGPSILGGLFRQSVLPIAAVTLATNLVLLPAATVALEVTRPRAAAGANHESLARVLFFRGIVPSVAKPYVWAPLLALVLVLIGGRVPRLIDTMLQLVGNMSSGLSVFAVGLMIAAAKIRINGTVAIAATIKMIVQPLIMLGVAVLMGIHGELTREAIVTVAFPTAIVAPMLAARYNVLQSEASSAVVVTVILMILVLPLLMLTS